MKDQYKVRIDPFWITLPLRGGDGYDDMDYARQKGWHAISSWGRDGYDLGSWPYAIVFIRRKEERVEIAVYVAGDVDQYAFPIEELLIQAIDEEALFHWKHNTRSAPDDIDKYATVDDLPPELRGPYR